MKYVLVLLVLIGCSGISASNSLVSISQDIIQKPDSIMSICRRNNIILEKQLVKKMQTDSMLSKTITADFYHNQVQYIKEKKNEELSTVICISDESKTLFISFIFYQKDSIWYLQDMYQEELVN